MNISPTRARRGMSSLQAVILLGAAFLVVWGLMQVWTEVSGTAKDHTKLTVRGEFLQSTGSAGAPATQASAPASSTGTTGAPQTQAPTQPIEGVIVRPDGQVVSTPIVADADGAGNGVTDVEQARNMNAVAVAVDQSPLGIAVIIGDHVGGPSGLDFRNPEGADHAAIAVRIGDQIVLFEMLPNDENNPILRNIGMAGSGPRDLADFALGYDTVNALPLAGLTTEQAERFVAALREITAAGQTYGFVDGNTCATAIVEAMNRAGIPNDLDTSTLGINDLLPASVIDVFEQLRNSPLGQQQLAGSGP